LLTTTGRTPLSIISAVIGPLSGRFTCAKGMHPGPTGSAQAADMRAAKTACRSGNWFVLGSGVKISVKPQTTGLGRTEPSCTTTQYRSRVADGEQSPSGLQLAVNTGAGSTPHSQ
jgi:hypothetical protein